MWLSSRVCVVGRHERVYYLACGGPGLLVDCGSEATYAENLRMLEADGADISSVKAILVTHEHFDHIGAIGRAKADLGCPVISHALAAPPIETGDRLVTASEMAFLGVDVPFLGARVDEKVDEGDRILLGDLEVGVHHLPGHTQGGAAYMFEGNLLVGDTVYSRGGIGWPDIHWGSCLGDHRDSLRKIARLRPKRILPGHGDAFAFEESIIQDALSKVDLLEQVGVPEMGAKPAPRRPPGEPGRTIRLPLGSLPGTGPGSRSNGTGGR